ncbi:MAG: hypothetical protein SPJ92_04570 [Bariatricus sp.]|nr:hypothetical protein [Bariatricus sp.]
MNDITKKIQSDNSDMFTDSFEVTCDGDFPDLPSDLGNDAYKDVLSQLSELDDEESIDYLATNKTRTLPFSKTVQDYMKPAVSDSSVNKKQGVRKELLYAIVFISILCILAVMAYTIR